MLAYPIDEAETMLTEKLRAAEASLSNCEEDLEFLREQITVSNTYSCALTLLTSLVLSVLFVSLESIFVRARDQ